MKSATKLVILHMKCPITAFLIKTYSNHIKNVSMFCRPRNITLTEILSPA
uniref:Uncharacterized protein n=1 Tax=Anguilla anguilla TaxID=7936 RepID=A0A0E9WJ98_ANGAN